MEDVKKVKEIVKKINKSYYEISDKIWENPEVGLEEEKSLIILKDFLEKNGFTVKTGLAGLSTSFVAEYGSGKPVIGFTAEYDALPGLSQEAYQTKKVPVCENNPGHGCGHNLLGVGSIGAALVLKEYVDSKNLSCTIKVFGTPSEERDAGKAFMGREGVFDGVDCGFTWHPHYVNSVWESGSLANTIVTFKFKGKSSHAAASPELGRSALDACELMNVGVNYLREHVPSDVRIHYAYLDVGGHAPNVVQDHAAIYYFIRASKMKDSTDTYERVKKIAHGAALMTETELEIIFDSAVSDFVPNPTLTKAMEEAMLDLGEVKYSDEEIEMAKSFVNTLGQNEINGAENLISRFLDKNQVENIKKRSLVSEYIKFGKDSPMASGSTDVGDFSNCAPVAQCLIATSAFATPLHSWQMVSQGKSSYAKKGLDKAVSTLALTAIRVLNNHDLVKKVREEYIEQTGGKYIAPIPKDVNVRDVNLYK